MMYTGRVLRALPLAACLALSACGGGEGGKTPVLISPGIGIGEPTPPPLNVTPFIEKARTEACSDVRNRLFVIDNKMVLSDRAGNCADNSYGQVLYGASVDNGLCSASDSIAGPVASCKDEASRVLFDTMRKNLDRPDLGLGAGHSVKEVFFLPAEGTGLALGELAKASTSAISTPRQLVVRDAAAFEALWREHGANALPAPALPKVNFATHMVIAVFAGAKPGCHEIRIQRVLVSGARLVAEYVERDINPFAVCIAAQSAPMHMMAVPRSDAPVEWRAIAGLPFTELAFTSYSYRSGGPLQTVVRDEASWASLWAAHATLAVPGFDPSQAAPRPAVDFSRNMVVAVFMGSQPNGCYGTRIDGIYRSGGKLQVAVLNSVPGDSSICTMALTSPAHMVQVARSEEHVEFHVQTLRSEPLGDR